MSKQPVHIYGDSYVDPFVVSSDYRSWADLLSQDFEVLNYGKSGTGPDYSIAELENHGGQFIIFFTGFPERYSWRNIPEEGLAVDISDRFYRDYVPSKKQREGQLEKWYNGLPAEVFEDFCEKHGESIKYAYKSLQKEILRRTEYMVGYLRNYADINEVRVIAVTQSNPWPKYKDFYLTIPKDVRDKLNTKYFSIYPYNIASVSRKEIKGTWDGRGLHDTRQNHLTKANHVVLYNNIISLLEQSSMEEHVFDREEFEKWFTLKPQQKFIYDE